MYPSVLWKPRRWFTTGAEKVNTHRQTYQLENIKSTHDTFTHVFDRPSKSECNDLIGNDFIL